MKFQRPLLLATLLSFFCLFITPFTSAAHHTHHYTDVNWQKVSKSKAAAIAQKKYGGKVLNVKRIDDDGIIKYRVKLLQKSGKVKVVTIYGE